MVKQLNVCCAVLHKVSPLFLDDTAEKMTQNLVQRLPIRVYLCIQLMGRSKMTAQCIESYVHDVDRGVELCNIVFENVEMKRWSQ